MRPAYTGVGVVLDKAVLPVGSNPTPSSDFGIKFVKEHPKQGTGLDRSVNAISTTVTPYRATEST